jgi:hypothetical protein
VAFLADNNLLLSLPSILPAQNRFGLKGAQPSPKEPLAVNNRTASAGGAGIPAGLLLLP